MNIDLYLESWSLFLLSSDTATFFWTDNGDKLYNNIAQLSKAEQLISEEVVCYDK